MTRVQSSGQGNQLATASPQRACHHTPTPGCHTEPFTGRAGWQGKKWHVLCILPDRLTDRTLSIPCSEPSSPWSSSTHTRAQQGPRLDGEAQLWELFAEGRAAGPGQEVSIVSSSPRPNNVIGGANPCQGLRGSGLSFLRILPAPTQRLWPAPRCDPCQAATRHTRVNTQTHTRKVRNTYPLHACSKPRRP